MRWFHKGQQTYLCNWGKSEVPPHCTGISMDPLYIGMRSRGKSEAPPLHAGIYMDPLSQNTTNNHPQIASNSNSGSKSGAVHSKCPASPWSGAVLRADPGVRASFTGPLQKEEEPMPAERLGEDSSVEWHEAAVTVAAGTSAVASASHEQQPQFTLPSKMAPKMLAPAAESAAQKFC